MISEIHQRSPVNPEAGIIMIVDGGGPERWVPQEEPANMPAQPRNFVANQNDLRADCWQDGGEDALDCFGRTTVTFNGRATSRCLFNRRQRTCGCSRSADECRQSYPK